MKGISEMENQKKEKEITTMQVIKNCFFAASELFKFNKAFLFINRCYINRIYTTIHHNTSILEFKFKVIRYFN